MEEQNRYSIDESVNSWLIENNIIGQIITGLVVTAIGLVMTYDGVKKHIDTDEEQHQS